MRNLLFLVALMCASCGRKKAEATNPVKRNMEIINEEDLEELPEAK
jgi:hypothetical protein